MYKDRTHLATLSLKIHIEDCSNLTFNYPQFNILEKCGLKQGKNKLLNLVYFPNGLWNLFTCFII